MLHSQNLWLDITEDFCLSLSVLCVSHILQLLSFLAFFFLSFFLPFYLSFHLSSMKRRIKNQLWMAEFKTSAGSWAVLCLPFIHFLFFIIILCTFWCFVVYNDISSVTCSGITKTGLIVSVKPNRKHLRCTLGWAESWDVHSRQLYAFSVHYHSVHSHGYLLGCIIPQL